MELHHTAEAAGFWEYVVWVWNPDPLWSLTLIVVLIVVMFFEGHYYLSDGAWRLKYAWLKRFCPILHRKDVIELTHIMSILGLQARTHQDQDYTVGDHLWVFMTEGCRDCQMRTALNARSQYEDIAPAVHVLWKLTRCKRHARHNLERMMVAYLLAVSRMLVHASSRRIQRQVRSMGRTLEVITERYGFDTRF